MTVNGRPDDPPQRSTLADVVYLRLHQDILLGRLRPNSLLIEGELAERLEVSRTPVREGLQRLAKDGLIVSRRRRWFVVEPSLQEIQESYDVRAALEGHAARLATERATAAQLDAITDALDSRGHAGPNTEDLVTSNDRFHRLIVQAAQSRRLTEAIEHSKHFYFNAHVARLYEPDDLKASQQQHESLVRAIRARDGDEADRITREHVSGAFTLIRERWIR